MALARPPRESQYQLGPSGGLSPAPMAAGRSLRAGAGAQLRAGRRLWDGGRRSQDLQATQGRPETGLWFPQNSCGSPVACSFHWLLEDYSSEGETGRGDFCPGTVASREQWSKLRGPTGSGDLCSSPVLSAAFQMRESGPEQ